MIKRLSIGVIAFLVLSTLLVFYILNTGTKNYERALQRTESDFTTEDFTINEIWEMKLVRTQGLNGEKTLQSYVFIKPQNQEFNLRFPDTDFNGEEKNKEKILSRIRVGDKITAKVIKAQLDEARQSGWLRRFITGDRHEVSIYKLTRNDTTVTERNINEYDVVEAGFMDRLTRVVAFAAIGIAAIFILTRTFFKKRKNNIQGSQEILQR